MSGTTEYETFIVIQNPDGSAEFVPSEQILTIDSTVEDLASQIDWDGDIEPGKVLVAGVKMGDDWYVCSNKHVLDV